MSVTNPTPTCARAATVQRRAPPRQGVHLLESHGGFGGCTSIRPVCEPPSVPPGRSTLPQPHACCAAWLTTCGTPTAVPRVSGRGRRGRTHTPHRTPVTSRTDAGAVPVQQAQPQLPYHCDTRWCQPCSSWAVRWLARRPPRLPCASRMGRPPVCIHSHIHSHVRVFMGMQCRLM